MPEEEIVPASESPSSARADKDGHRLKSLAALIAAIAALLTAGAAFLKPQDETMTKAGYEELRKSVADLTLASSQNHDDLVALRSYLAGYANGIAGAEPKDAGEAIPTLPPPVRPPPPHPSATSAVPPLVHEKAAVRPPRDFSQL